MLHPHDIENRQAYSFRHVANLPEASAGTHGAVGHEEILFLSCVPDRLPSHAVPTLKRLGEIRLIEATRGFATEEPGA